MLLYVDDRGLDRLHQRWRVAQVRMLEAHDAARSFDSRLANDESMTPEELVAGADLAAKARDATEAWLQIDKRFSRDNLAYLERRRHGAPV